jgi:nitrate/nitrite transport system ATP-binding protein
VAGYIELFRLAKSYTTSTGPVSVVKGFDLDIARGELVALVGHSGCGKSTVLGMVAGLIEITSGSVVVAGREIDGPGPDRAVVFQSPALLPWMTACDNVRLGVDRLHPRATSRERREIAEHYLELVGLEDARNRYPRELSGGMQQRVGIARAFALAPRAILLDEPFGMLDSLTRMDLEEVLLGLLDVDQKTGLMVTHDVDEALFMADRLVLMTEGPEARVGEILEIPFPRPRVRPEVLEHPDYYELRSRVMAFLEEQEMLRRPRGRSFGSLEQALPPEPPSFESAKSATIWEICVLSSRRRMAFPFPA